MKPQDPDTLRNAAALIRAIVAGFNEAADESTDSLGFQILGSFECLATTLERQAEDEETDF